MAKTPFPIVKSRPKASPPGLKGSMLLPTLFGPNRVYWITVGIVGGVAVVGLVLGIW